MVHAELFIKVAETKGKIDLHKGRIKECMSIFTDIGDILNKGQNQKDAIDKKFTLALFYLMN